MNLLIINADQLRHDCVGYRGLRPVATPNLDALAGEGTVYTRAFTPLPVCAPARQALLCGRHPDSFGAQWNYDFIPTPTVQPEWCWSRDLRDRGFQTGYLGRFHVSSSEKPDAFGYDEWINWAGHKQLIKDRYADAVHDGGWLGCASPIPVEDAGTHWMADQAAAMIRQFAEKGKPWHVWVDYEEPHLPCRPSEPYASMYDPNEIEPWDGFGDDFSGKPYCQRQQMINWQTDQMGWSDFAPMVARYYGVVSQLDDAIGRILKALRDTGQWADTVIVFTSDHGDMCGSHQMLDKHYVLYDDIVRVPLLVKRPGVDACESDAFVSNCLDLPASIREWFGLGAAKVTHGVPLGDVERDAIVATSNGQQFGLYTTRMIRDARYKYVWNLTDVDELYDLDEDPGEKRTLIASEAHEELIARMRRMLFEQLKAHGDPFVRSDWMQRQLLDGVKHIR